MDDGTIVAGGLYGLNVFNPDYIRYNKMLPKVMFSNLSLFDEPVEVGRRYDHNLILPEELDKVRKIVLDHKQNILRWNWRPTIIFYQVKRNIYTGWTNWVMNGCLWLPVRTALRLRI